VDSSDLRRHGILGRTRGLFPGRRAYSSVGSSHRRRRHEQKTRGLLLPNSPGCSRLIRAKLGLQIPPRRTMGADDASHACGPPMLVVWQATRSRHAAPRKVLQKQRSVPRELELQQRQRQEQQKCKKEGALPTVLKFSLVLQRIAMTLIHMPITDTRLATTAP
jgi:hypothetical protein